MKFLVAFVALVAVAVANPLFKPSTSEAEQLETIIAAIQSPSTDPATATLLEAMLADLLGVGSAVVGPAIVESPEYETPVAGPAIIDFPVNEGSVDVSPVVIEPTPQGATPLVQIIVNVRNAAPVAGPATGVDAAAISPPVEADSVLIAESSPEEADSVLVVDSVIVADGPASGVIVADLEAPSVVPIAVGTPAISSPANLPEELN